MKPKTVITVVKVTGTVLGVAASLITGWADKKRGDKLLADLVDTKLAEKLKERGL